MIAVIETKKFVKLCFLVVLTNNLVLLCKAQENNATDYCNTKYCKAKNTHVACNNDGVNIPNIYFILFIQYFEEN